MAAAHYREGGRRGGIDQGQRIYSVGGLCGVYCRTFHLSMII